MQRYKLQYNDNNEFFCEPMVTREEWLSVVEAVDSQKNSIQLDVMLMFFRQPSHTASCFAIGKQSSMSDSAISNYVWQFGRFTQNYLGNRFSVECAENEKDTFWPIAMLGRKRKDCFEYTVRPELCDALRDFLIIKMIRKYKEIVMVEGLDNSSSKELYKWQISANCQGKSTAEILNIILSPTCNLVEKAHAGATVTEILKNSPSAVIDAFDLLRGDKPINERLAEFSEAARKLTPQGKTQFGDERMAASFLFCLNPQMYTPYTSTIYSEFCGYLGEVPAKSKQKYAHFLQLLESVVDKERQDNGLQECLRRETAGYVWSDILNAQDVVWQTMRYLKDRMPKNWLQNIYDNALMNKHWVFEEWYPRYAESVDKFRSMFSEGMTADLVPEDTKHDYLRAAENYISANTQGTYSSEEYAKIKEWWSDIYSILKGCFSKDMVTKEDDAALSAIISPLTKKNKKAAQHRLWAAILPNVLATIISDDKLKKVYEKIRVFDESLPKSVGEWLSDNITLMEYFKSKVEFREPLHRALFAWYLHEELIINDSSKMEKYSKLLLSNHNLILTGAPGTGKTYLAKKIAEYIGAGENVKMVQFHPLYDYSDFVEGLRPCQDKDGFERVDGVFKAFCKKAIKASVSNLCDNFEEIWDKLVEYLNNNQYAEVPLVSGSKSIKIELNEYGTGLAERTYENDEFVDGQWIKGQSKFFSKDQLYNIYRGLKGVPSGGHDNYRKAVVAYMKKSLGLRDYVKGELNDDNQVFVFIIDEINRGELSKIFGELFYSIEPSYRGEKGRVDTQYQNMVPIGDQFEEGFYVPENVYIIGTMNDIDRSVESMDFAIRRRFAWMEVKAEDRIEMLDENIGEYAEKAVKSMCGLNKAIVDSQIGLSSAYHIGPAYYLKLKNYDGDFDSLWTYHVEGVLREYLRGMKNIEEKIAHLKSGFDAYKE